MKDRGLLGVEIRGFEDEWYFPFDTCDQDFSDSDTHEYVALDSFDHMCKYVLSALTFGACNGDDGGFAKEWAAFKGSVANPGEGDALKACEKPFESYGLDLVLQ